MPKQFYIARKNSSRWVEQNITFDARYNTVPLDFQTDEYCYYSLRQPQDKEPIQFLSDWPCELKYYYAIGNTIGDLVYTAVITEVPNSIVGQTFKCYETEIDWSAFAVNRSYIGLLTYTDDDSTIHTWACTPVDLRNDHKLSRLFEYRNNDNQDEDGIIWSTGITMNIRVDALVEKPIPKSNRSQYIDQDYDDELLFGQSFIWFSLKLLDANKLGLPFWVLDKMNRIFTECDQVTIDGTLYSAVDGQEFKLTRPEGGFNQDAYAEIDIQYEDNPNFGQLEVGDQPSDDSYLPMQVPLEFVNKGAPFSFANVFKANRKLTFINLTNNGGTEFDMQIGTTLGGSQIGEYTITTDAQQVIDVQHYFSGAATLYITIPNGVNISGFVEWIDLKATPITPGPTTVTPYNTGDIHFYSDLANYASQFDNAGVGIIGSAHEGCVVCGTNGVYESLDWGNATLIHNLLNMGTMSNNGTITVAKTNLPAEGVLMFKTGDAPQPKPNGPLTPTKTPTTGRSVGGSSEYFMYGDVATADVGLSGNLGDGTPLPNIPKGLRGVFFTYVS